MIPIRQKKSTFFYCFILMLQFFFFTSLFSPLNSADPSSEKSVSDPVREEMVPKSDIPYSNIKNLIKSDLLEEVVEKKNEQKLILQKEKQQKIIDTYNFPGMDEFWSIISELWLVKNATTLKWDFEHPSYGLEGPFKELLSGLGFYEIRFKILICNSLNPTHFALPANPGEFIFILSLPFIRTMNLSKEEISLLLLEDFFRIQMPYFLNYLSDKELDTLYGKNFYQKKLSPDLIPKLLKNYTYFIFNKGYTFQEQYEITKKIGDTLRPHPNLYKSYSNLLFKIDTLVKKESTFKHHLKIYPSPEMQIRWINSNEK